MSSRKTLKSVSVEELKPTVTLTPVIESCGEGCRIHHIKSDSIARDGRDTFVPLRHVSKQKRRIFELEEQNVKLREQVTRLQSDWESERDYADQMEAKEKMAVAENDKLRELVKNALTYIEYEGCGVECPETGNSATLTPCDTCNRYETESCAYVIAQSARELGIEVER